MTVSNVTIDDCVLVTNLLLTQVVRQVGDHDLCPGWNAVLRWATLARLARRASFWSSSTLVSSQSLLRGASECVGLSWYIGWAIGDSYSGAVFRLGLYRDVSKKAMEAF